MSCLHTDGETEVGDDRDIPYHHATRPSRTTVPNMDKEDPDYDDSDERPGFIE